MYVRVLRTTYEIPRTYYVDRSRWFGVFFPSVHRVRTSWVRPSSSVVGYGTEAFFTRAFIQSEFVKSSDIPLGMRPCVTYQTILIKMYYERWYIQLFLVPFGSIFACPPSPIPSVEIASQIRYDGDFVFLSSTYTFVGNVSDESMQCSFWVCFFDTFVVIFFLL